MSLVLDGVLRLPHRAHDGVLVSSNFLLRAVLAQKALQGSKNGKVLKGIFENSAFPKRGHVIDSPDFLLLEAKKQNKSVKK